MADGMLLYLQVHCQTTSSSFLQGWGLNSTGLEVSMQPAWGAVCIMTERTAWFINCGGQTVKLAHKRAGRWMPGQAGCPLCGGRHLPSVTRYRQQWCDSGCPPDLAARRLALLYGEFISGLYAPSMYTSLLLYTDDRRRRLSCSATLRKEQSVSCSPVNGDSHLQMGPCLPSFYRMISI